MNDDPEKQRFNPFLNEGDMFKVVLWVGAVVLVAILIAVVVRGVF